MSCFAENRELRTCLTCREFVISFMGSCTDSADGAVDGRDPVDNAQVMAMRAAYANLCIVTAAHRSPPHHFALSSTRVTQRVRHHDHRAFWQPSGALLQPLSSSHANFEDTNLCTAHKVSKSMPCGRSSAWQESLHNLNHK
eukprot:1716835-Rhodomonas_salina.2